MISLTLAACRSLSAAPAASPWAMSWPAVGAIASSLGVLTALALSLLALRSGRAEARARHDAEQAQHERAQADQVAAWVEINAHASPGAYGYFVHVSNASALPISMVTVMVSTGPAVEQADMVRMHSVGPGGDGVCAWREGPVGVAPREVPPIQALTFTDARGWRWEKAGDSLVRHYIDDRGDAATRTY